MRVCALVTSVLLLLTLPVSAAQYGGKTIDGRRLPVKVYSYATGGVFNAEVEFKRDIATLYFVGGSQLLLRLNQPTIRDSNNILGYGRVGQLPLGRSFSIGIRGDSSLNSGSNTGSTGSFSVGGGALSDLWKIMLSPEALQ